MDKKNETFVLRVGEAVAEYWGEKPSVNSLHVALQMCKTSDWISSEIKNSNLMDYLADIEMGNGGVTKTIS